MIPVFAQNRPISALSSPAKAIYRLLGKGDIIQARDAVYCPAEDLWKPLPADLIGSAYKPKLGPVRRFNK